MKHIIFCFLLLAASKCFCQDIPKPADPCQKLDTDKIKQLILGKWVDVGDSTHTLVIIWDSVEETIYMGEGTDRSKNVSYFNYKFTDNLFSSDAVTCYSIVEYIPGFPHHTDFAINYIDEHYMLLGAFGRHVFKRVAVKSQ